MNYLTDTQMRIINQLVVRETGGLLGVRDSHTISSLENLPRQTMFGKELYPDVFIKAALYARNIIMGHPFLDGNKRTGIACALTFLESNEIVFRAKKGEIEKFAIRIVIKKLELKDIALWFRKHSHKK